MLPVAQVQRQSSELQSTEGELETFIQVPGAAWMTIFPCPSKGTNQ